MYDGIDKYNKFLEKLINNSPDLTSIDITETNKNSPGKKRGTTDDEALIEIARYLPNNTSVEYTLP